MTITGGCADRVIYGCHAHRYRGTCSNALNIRRDVLEQQLIAALAQRLRTPDVLEYALQNFYGTLRQRLKESQKAAREAASQSVGLRDRLAVLMKQAHNICDAIASDGHRNSPSLLSRLRIIDAEIENVNSRLRQAEMVNNEVPISDQQLREFVTKKAADFQSVLVGDAILAKDALRKHVRRLVLKPNHTPSGPVYEVSGDVDLFAGDSHVMQMVPGTRFGSTSAHIADFLVSSRTFPRKRANEGPYEARCAAAAQKDRHARKRWRPGVATWPLASCSYVIPSPP